MPALQFHNLVILPTIYSPLGSKRDTAKQKNLDAKEWDNRNNEIKDKQINNLTQVADLWDLSRPEEAKKLCSLSGSESLNQGMSSG